LKGFIPITENPWLPCARQGRPAGVSDPAQTSFGSNPAFVAKDVQAFVRENEATSNGSQPDSGGRIVTNFSLPNCFSICMADCPANDNAAWKMISLCRPF
jgi:hypothetical protein